MLVAATAHVINPDFYAPLVPDFINLDFANISSTLAEAAIGILLLLPKYRHWGGLGFALLMVGFMPLHIWELFREQPLVGPPPAPVIRVVIQVLLIYVGWWVYQKHKPADG